MPLKVLTLSALSLASFSALAMEKEVKKEVLDESKDIRITESLKCMAKLLNRTFEDAYKLKTDSSGNKTYHSNGIRDIQLWQKLALANVGDFMDHNKIKDLSMPLSELKGKYPHYVTVAVYKNYLCPNPYYESDFLKNLKRFHQKKETIYLTLKDFANKQNRSTEVKYKHE